MGEMNEVTIYTDGACLGNPGPGGYAAVLLRDGRRKEMKGGFKLTTNNRMELLAAINALEALDKECRVTLYSDSSYLVNAMTKGWAHRWQKMGWRRNRKEAALNPDLWQRLLDAVQAHQVTFRWVKGHHTSADNCRCDQLANEAARKPGLSVDEGYLRPPATGRLL